MSTRQTIHSNSTEPGTAPIICCNEECDLRLIPPGVVSEGDRFEIRLQARNVSSKVCNLTIELNWDKEAPATRLLEKTLPVAPGEFAFVRCFHKLHGIAGRHQLLATLRFDGQEIKLRRKVEVRPTTGNLLEGGFVVIGAPNDRHSCDGINADLKSLTDEQWRARINSWNEIGMKILIIFDTYQPMDLKDGKIYAHYPSEILPMTSDLKSKDPIKAILDAAKDNGQNVFLGLGAFTDSDFLDSGRIPELIEELFRRYGRISSFYGWYASAEGSTASANPEIMGEYWKKLHAVFKRFSPVMPVLSSPYQESFSFDAPSFDINSWDFKTPSTKLGSIQGVHPEFERYLIANPDCIDILMPQDGIGGFRHALDTCKNNRSFALFREICDRTQIHLWANCESFDLAHESVDFYKQFPKLVPRFLNGGFNGEEGFVQQITAVRPHVEKVLTFTLPGMFACPGILPEIGGPAAVEQYCNYRNYLSCPVPAYRNLALGKPYVKSPEPGYWGKFFFPDFDNHRLTDGHLCGGYCYPIDDARLIGYYFEDAHSDQMSVDITIDLQAVEIIDAVRCAAALRQVRGKADRISVFLSDTGGRFEPAGSVCEYHNGWAQVVFDQPRRAQYVKITFYKKQPKEKYGNNWADNWLLMDEIEVLRRIDRR